MQKGLVVHNLMQVTIPLWLVPLLFFAFPRDIEPRLYLFWLSVFTVLGTLIPDIDHGTMWKKYKYLGFRGFVKFCMHADRYRKAFLPFHNHFAIYVVAGSALATYLFVDFFLSMFFVAFFIHVVFDYIADLYLIKQHTHWRLRNWFHEGYSGFSAPQQVQQSDKQKHHSGKSS